MALKVEFDTGGVLGHFVENDLFVQERDVLLPNLVLIVNFLVLRLIYLKAY